MRTAEDCRRQATRMNFLAAQSPALRDQYLRMAQLWERFGDESAQTEGLEDKQPSPLGAPSSVEAPPDSQDGQPVGRASGDDAELA
jgi:hypothetical protein